MAENWEKIKDNFHLLAGLLEESKVANNHNFGTMESEFGALGLKVSLLDTRIGKPDSIDGFLSVWEGVDHLLVEVKKLTETMGELHSKVDDTSIKVASAMRDKGQLSDAIDRLWASLKNVSDHHQDCMER